MDSPRIKLFGTTIALQGRQVNEEEESNKEEQGKGEEKMIPCPRCKSMETKFCYFNNYNVNQPRHFCRGCQRYWTAGGVLRNVPVGAGRRKVKPPCQEAAYGGVHQYDFDATMEEWHVVVAQEGYQNVFHEAKRRRS